MRFLSLIAFAAVVVTSPAAGQSDTSLRADSLPVRVADSVRVWSAKMDFKGRRGIVSRIDRDSLGFMSPTGFRKIPRAYAVDLPSVDRLDVLAKRKRSARRIVGTAFFGGLAGAGGFALIGNALGAVLDKAFGFDKPPDPNPNVWNFHGIFEEAGRNLGYILGGFGGLTAGAISGVRAGDEWRRVK